MIVFITTFGVKVTISNRLDQDEFRRARDLKQDNACFHVRAHEFYWRCVAEICRDSNHSNRETKWGG